MQTNLDVGRHGEEIARSFVRSRHGDILETNYRCKLGELDIIARHGRDIVFIEVKTRRSQEYGGAIAAITEAKRRRLLRLAKWWLSTYRKPFDTIRIELFAIQLLPTGRWQLDVVPVVSA